jgi:hypothetical protein
MGGSYRASSTKGFAGANGSNMLHPNLKTLSHLQVNSKFVLLNKFS